MKILINACDNCGESRSIVLHSEDGAHHLCEDCAALFLGAILKPTSSEVIPFGDGEKVTCVFCGGTWLSNHTAKPFLFAMKGEEFVCDPCLLEAARSTGKFRIIKDC